MRLWSIICAAVVAVACPSPDTAVSAAGEHGASPGSSEVEGQGARDHVAPTPSAEPSSAGSGGGADGAAGRVQHAEAAFGSGSAGHDDGVADGSTVDEALAPPSDPDAQLRADAQGFGPVSDALRAAIWGVPEDAPPEVLNATREDLENRHYLTCDELNLHLWYEHVRDIGGAYAGVGSDQAYTFIGWMRPSVAWLTDYDPWVKAVHEIYALAFERADDIDAFRDFWRDDNEDASWEAIEQRYGSADDFQLIRAAWRDWRTRINRRLRRYQDVLGEAEIPSFLTDQDTYEFVRDFVASGRVRPLLANLLDETALRAIGDLSRRIDVPVRVLYLSNAEDYWEYPDTFRENMEALYFDERSVVLRTDAAKRSNGDYRYCLQPALNFREWLRQDYVDEVADVWEKPYVRDETDIPLTILDEAPFER